MEPWLASALDYVPRWLEFQRRLHDQPGCVVAVAHRGRVVLEAAFGAADLATGEPLTPRHRFRAASHSKTFTAAGIMKLVEAGRLRLDDPIATYVPGLHPAAGEATLGQLLSHSAGLVRDGPDSGQFTDRRPYRTPEEVRQDLAAEPPFPAAMRFKYSNHGYALLGMAIEAVAGEPYLDWIAREVVAAAGLEETVPDIVRLRDAPMARGHSGRLPLGRRVVIPGDNPTHAIAAAGGFVATAADLVRFFGALSPNAEPGLLSAASRREMTRRHWRDQDTRIERYYGLGTMSGPPGPWAWFGHGGAFQGFITRTAVVPERDLAIAVLTNAIDGPAHFWVEGILHILERFAQEGAPAPEVRDWTGRWWSLWIPTDLVPMGRKVVAALPGTFTPFVEGSEIEVLGPDRGRIARAPGFLSPGEPVRRVRGADGAVREVWLGGGKLVAEEAMREELETRYGGPIST